MTSLSDSKLRRESPEFHSSMSTNASYELGPNAAGPITVFFRLIPADNSPGHQVHQPLTPLHTPFTQSPINSPLPGGPVLNTGLKGNERAMLYPLPSPTIGPLSSPTLPGVYFTAAPRHPSAFFPANGMHFPVDQDMNAVKTRAMSAEVHHSPPFHFVPQQTHRGSFCLPLETGGDLALVSEEMLISAMPERYDD